jgi:ketosteroid isomerase-like protein
MSTSKALTILSLILLVLLGGCAGGQKPAPAVDTAAITATLDSLGQAFNAAVAAKDTNAIVAMYADDASMLPPNMPRADGRDAIHKGWVGFMSTPGVQLTAKAGPPLIAQAGDMAVVVGTYDFKAMGPKKKPLSDVGKFVTMYKLVNGQWKMQVDTWNSDMPMPGQGK